MVYLWENLQDPTRLNAYLLRDLSSDELTSFKAAFEFGTMAPFSTMLELAIRKAPAEYLDKPHAYIRAQEDAAGRTDPFILIDEEVASKGAVWYVDRFADADEVADELAESTGVVWKILTKTESLPLAAVNYEIGNMSVVEDLDDCGVDYPVKADADFYQPRVAGAGEHDCDIAELRYKQTAFLTAYPGEYEVSTDPELLKGWAPVPDKVGRLKEDVAKEIGVKATSWTLISAIKQRQLKDGTIKEFPEGSVSLQHQFDPDFPWPPYKWPEGSL